MWVSAEETSFEAMTISNACRMACKRTQAAFDAWRSRAKLTSHCNLLVKKRRAQSARALLSSSFWAWQHLAEDRKHQVHLVNSSHSISAAQISVSLHTLEVQ